MNENSKISIGYFFCDQPSTINQHITRWKAFPKNLRRNLEFILIDTGSKQIPTIEKGDLNLSTYSITEYIEWNYGARNLIHHVANNRWVFHSNVDHILDSESCKEMLQLDKQNKFFYMFNRKNNQHPDNKRYNENVHPGTFLLTKDAFWMAGGIEEELSGHYGYDDSILIQCLEKRGFRKKIPNNITIENLSLSKKTEDADFINGGTWSRDLTRNKSIFKSFSNGQYKLSTKRLDFTWKKNDPKKVLYTCIVDDYDSLKDIKFQNDFRYVVFTNSKSFKPSNKWEIKPLVWEHPFDATRTARYHKHHPQILFPEADVTIWLDATHWPYCDIEPILNCVEKHDIAAMKHFKRKTIKSEAVICSKIKKDVIKTMVNQIQRYNNEGFPDDLGLFTTTCLVRKNNEKIKQLQELWWSEIEKESKRDQLSFTYCLWKLNMTCGVIPGVCREGPNPFFDMKPHDGPLISLL